MLKRTFSRGVLTGLGLESVELIAGHNELVKSISVTNTSRSESDILKYLFVEDLVSYQISEPT